MAQPLQPPPEMTTSRTAATRPAHPRSSARRELPLRVALLLSFAAVVACGGSQSSTSTGSGGAQGTGGSPGSGGASSGSGGQGGQGGGGGGTAGRTGGGGAAGGATSGSGSGGSAGGAGAGIGGANNNGGRAGGGAAGTSSGGTAGQGAGGAGGGGGATGSSCDLATNGAPCSQEGQTCGGPCPDACQFCHLTRCSGGHWQDAEAFPAPCFSCGDKTCQAQSQYCQTTSGGPVGVPISYACKGLPTACQSARTCACLAQQNVAGSCTMTDQGELTTMVANP